MLDMGRARLIVGIRLWGAGGWWWGEYERWQWRLGFGIRAVLWGKSWLNIYAHHHPVALPCHTPRAAKGMFALARVRLLCVLIAQVRRPRSSGFQFCSGGFAIWLLRLLRHAFGISPFWKDSRG